MINENDGVLISRIFASIFLRIPENCKMAKVSVPRNGK